MGQCLEYLPHDSYLVLANCSGGLFELDASLSNLADVSWVTPLDSEHKVSTDLAQAQQTLGASSTAALSARCRPG